MLTTTTMAKAYVEGWVNWLFPASVSFNAMPKALTAMTEIDPVVAQMER